MLQGKQASNDDNLYLHASMFGVLAAIPYSIIISAQKVIKQNILFAVVLCWRYHWRKKLGYSHCLPWVPVGNQLFIVNTHQYLDIDIFFTWGIYLDKQTVFITPTYSCTTDTLGLFICVLKRHVCIALLYGIRSGCGLDVSQGGINFTIPYKLQTRLVCNMVWSQCL